MPICDRCEKNVNGVHTCTPKRIMSECCSDGVYALAGYFKIDANDEEAMKMIPRGTTISFECMKCRTSCNVK